MTIKVPLKSLRLPGIYPGSVGPDGKEEKEVLPEAGDPVSFSVEGVVTGVTDDMGDVEVRFINGERPGAQDAEGAENGGATKNPEADEAASLAKMAEEADAEEA